MLDLRLIREHPDDVQRALAEKGGAELIPEILARDAERRRLVKEADDLKALGYSAADIQLMIDGGNGYQGPRLAIDETGLWRSFTTMGE